MASKGATGAGSTFSIGSTPVVVGQVKTIQFNGQKITYDDLTNLSSPMMGTSTVVMGEKLPAKAEAGTLAIGFTYLPLDPGYQALLAAFESQALTAFTVQSAKVPPQTTTGNSFAFSGYVSEQPLPDIQVDKTMTSKVTIEISGLIIVTPGT